MLSDMLASVFKQHPVVGALSDSQGSLCSPVQAIVGRVISLAYKPNAPDILNYAFKWGEYAKASGITCYIAKILVQFVDRLHLRYSPDFR